MLSFTQVSGVPRRVAIFAQYSRRTDCLYGPRADTGILKATDPYVPIPLKKGTSRSRTLIGSLTSSMNAFEPFGVMITGFCHYP
jgi:hypothetical protein